MRVHAKVRVNVYDDECERHGGVLQAIADALGCEVSDIRADDTEVQFTGQDDVDWWMKKVNAGIDPWNGGPLPISEDEEIPQ